MLLYISFDIGSEEKSERLSTNSKISQKKNSTNRLASNRTISQQQSIVNSKRSSPLFRSNFDINEPIKLHSIHGKDTLSIGDADGV